MKNLAIALARRAGLAVYAQWRLESLPHARKLQQLFDFYDIRYALDIGANQGQFVQFLRLEVGFKGSIHSFEPVSHVANQLEKRWSHDSTWRGHRIAVGAERKHLDINVMRSAVFSSFLTPSAEHVPELAQKNTITGTERVEMRTLDDLCSDILRNIDLSRTFLKLDTQGFDLEVLRGGSLAMAEIPVVQSEISMQPVYQGMPGFAQSIDAFATLGFSVSDIFLVSEDRHRRAIEFDCIFVRAGTAAG